MTTERVELGPDIDLEDLVARVRQDKIPRIIEQDGETLAVVISPEDFVDSAEPKSKRQKDRLLSLAGVWKDVDADHMIEEIDRHRRQAAPSNPVAE